MFLKRLDIAGFKSFAEKVSIDFVPGVTAVVGPNGSGKSNITDAIPLGAWRTVSQIASWRENGGHYFCRKRIAPCCKC